MTAGTAGVDVLAPDFGGSLLKIVGWVLDAKVGGDGENGLEKRRVDVDDGFPNVDKGGVVGASERVGALGGGVHGAIIRVAVRLRRGAYFGVLVPPGPNSFRGSLDPVERDLARSLDGVGGEGDVGMGRGFAGWVHRVHTVGGQCAWWARSAAHWTPGGTALGRITSPLGVRWLGMVCRL